MKITLLCNAGLAIEAKGAMLLIDLPNMPFEPFYTLPEETWQLILRREAPYDKVCGFWFTHEHPDHCNRMLVQKYLERWPDTPCFFPQDHPTDGTMMIGPFAVKYRRMEHAPISEPPVHVVTMVTVGEKRVYIAADAALEPEKHWDFLQGRGCDAAVWNSMYLSRPDTRDLMRKAAKCNFVYHMPAKRPDGFGLWKKLERNFERFGPELAHVTVWDAYPSETSVG